MVVLVPYLEKTTIELYQESDLDEERGTTQGGLYLENPRNNNSKFGAASKLIFFHGAKFVRLLLVVQYEELDKWLEWKLKCSKAMAHKTNKLIGLEISLLSATAQPHFTWSRYVLSLFFRNETFFMHHQMTTSERFAIYFGI